MNSLSFFQLHRFFRFATIGGVLGVGFGALVFFYFAFGPLFSVGNLSTASRENNDHLLLKEVEIEQEDLGALALDRNENEIPIPNIQNHIVIYSMNDRTDVSRDTERFLIGIRGDYNRKIVRPKERIYLGFNDLFSGQLRFDDIPSPIWIRLDKQRDQIIMEVGLDVIDEMGDKVIQNRRIYALEPPQSCMSVEEIQDLDLAMFVQQLNSVQCYLPDQLYDTFAPDDLNRGKYRLQIDQQNHKSVNYIGMGTELFFNDKTISDQRSEGVVAKVVNLQGEYVTIKAWSADGIEKVILKLPIAVPEPFDFNVNELVKRLRKRTSTSVSCVLGNKNTQLRKGDWVLHTKMGWRVLRKQADVLDVLHHKLIGELLIFDGIEKSNGQGFFVAYLFDRTRSFVKRLYIPFADGTKKSHRKDKQEINQAMPEEKVDETDFDESVMEFDYFDFDF